MSSVGGVGGAVGPSATGGGSTQAVTPAGGAADSGDFSGGGGAGAIDSAKSSGDDASSASHVNPMCSHGSDMSTQNFIQLHNSSVTQIDESQSPEMDLKKLIEMMMAIKLLETVNENK